MMISDIKLVEIAGMKCIDMAMATAAHFFQRDFELMFADAWKFTYRDTNSVVIGGCISAGSESFSQNLEKYHGVEILIKNIPGQKECFDALISYLDKGMPIDIGYDQAYLPWAKEMRKKAPLRYGGNILFIGHDDKTFKCIDIHGSHRNEVLPFKNFLEYANDVESIMTYSFQKKTDIIDFDLQNHVNSTMNYLFKNDGMFNHMLNYANRIRETLNFQQEIEYTKEQGIDLASPNWILMVADIIEVGRMRALYSISLKYLASIYKNTNLDKLCNDFKIVWSKWQMIVSILVKSYYKKNYENLNLHISNKILEIIDAEKELADCLVKVFNPKMNSSKYEKNDEISNTQYRYLYINNYFNNKALSTKLNDDKADFDSLGNYFLFTNIKISSLIIGNELKFKMQINGKDNIRCLGQFIKFNLYSARKIYLLGACESGAFFGTFKVCFEDGYVQEEIVGFGEWRFGKCELGEKLEYVADRVYFNKVSDQEKAYIFSNVIDIQCNKKIIGIQLPNCENIHIFAITLAV